MECASLCSLTSLCSAFSWSDGDQTCDLANAENMVAAAGNGATALDFYIEAGMAGQGL